MSAKWQPARWRQVHKRIPEFSPETIAEMRSTLFLVRPRNCTPSQSRLEEKCDATKFYEVKGWNGVICGVKGWKGVICEHEILTD